MIPTQEIRPKGFWYAIGGGLIGLGVVLAIVVFVVAFRRPFEEFQQLSDDIDSLQRFDVPGTARVNLNDTGDFVLYAEGNGSTAPLSSLDPSSITVESTEPDSTPLPLRQVGLDETYDFGGPAGRSSLEFTVDEPGEYLVTVSTAPSDVTAVAVGPPLDLFGAISSILVAVFVPIGVGSVFVIAGAIVLIVTGVRRSGSARRLRMAANPPPGAWAPTAGTWPPPGAGGYPAQPPPPTPTSAPPTWPPPPTSAPPPPRWPPE